MKRASPTGSVVKNLSEIQETACNVGDVGSILGSGRSPGEGNDYPLQYSCLENSMDREAWWAIIQESDTAIKPLPQPNR